MTRTSTGVILAVAAALVGGLMGVGERPPSPSPAGPIPQEAVRQGRLEVHVSGWVVSPGVVVLESGSNVADAIEMAGGLRPGALAGQINLAASILDGDQILVPGPDDRSHATASEGRIALNRASAAELQDLPGVGPVLAERIVSHRDANGPFSQVEDLLEVPGIGEAKLASIRDLIRVP